MLTPAPKKLITDSLIAEIKSKTGVSFFWELYDIKKAIHAAIAEFKIQNKPDQAERLQALYDGSFGRMALDVWLFTSRAKKDEWIADFQNRLASLRLSEAIAIKPALEKKPSLDDFYKKIIDYVDTPYRMAVDNIIKDEELVQSRDPVFLAIQKHNGLRDSEYIKENLRLLIKYIKGLQNTPEYKIFASEFAKKRPVGGPDFAVFLEKLTRMANTALKSDHYSDILEQTLALQSYWLNLYNLAHPDHPIIQNRPSSMSAGIDFGQPEIKTPLPPPQKIQTQLKERLNTIVNAHIKKIQYFEVSKITTLSQIEAKANHFYLLQQPSGEWELYRFSEQTKAPKKVSLYAIPGLKSIVTKMKPEDFFKNKGRIQTLLTKYLTLPEQIKRFQNFGVVISSQLPEEIMGTDRYKFYLVRQKPSGFKLYAPDKNGKQFIELSPSLFPGLAEILKNIHPGNLNETMFRIKEILFTHALSMQLNVYDKIDQRLFQFVNSYLKETPPDFLKIFIAASLAKSKMHHEQETLTGLMQEIAREFPIYNNSDWLLGALKNQNYENIVLDFNKIWVENLESIHQNYTLQAIDKLSEEEASKVLTEADSILREIARKSQKNHAQFVGNDYKEAKKYIERTEDHLEELFDLRHDILLANAVPDMSTLLKGFTEDRIKEIDNQIEILKSHLAEYQRHLTKAPAVIQKPKKVVRDFGMIELEIKPIEAEPKEVAVLSPPPEEKAPVISIKDEKKPEQKNDDVQSAQLISPFLAKIDAIYKNKSRSVSPNDFFDWLKGNAFVNSTRTQYNPNEAQERQANKHALEKITNSKTMLKDDKKRYSQQIKDFLKKLPSLRTEQILQIDPQLKFDELLMALIFANARSEALNKKPPSPPTKRFSINGFHFDRFKFFKRKPRKPKAPVIVEKDVRSTLVDDIYQLANANPEHAEKITQYQEQLKRYQDSETNPEKQTINGFIKFCQKSRALKPF